MFPPSQQTAQQARELRASREEETFDSVAVDNNYGAMALSARTYSRRDSRSNTRLEVDANDEAPVAMSDQRTT
eukprot:745644-Hanusia_phi.AAC.1